MLGPAATFGAFVPGGQTWTAPVVRLALGSGAEQDLRAYAQEELVRLEERLVATEAELKVLLIPKDPNDEKNVILEIRAGTGGEEAALFAGELFRMYSKFAERQGWRIDVMSTSETGVGGVKEVTDYFKLFDYDLGLLSQAFQGQ